MVSISQSNRNRSLPGKVPFYPESNLRRSPQRSLLIPRAFAAVGLPVLVLASSIFRSLLQAVQAFPLSPGAEIATVRTAPPAVLETDITTTSEKNCGSDETMLGFGESLQILQTKFRRRRRLSELIGTSKPKAKPEHNKTDLWRVERKCHWNTKDASINLSIHRNSVS